MRRTLSSIWRMVLPIASLSVLLGACTNFSGLDGSTEYSCKAPQGVQCDSVSGNYYNAIQNNLPSQRHSSKPKTKEDGNDTGDAASALPHMLGPDLFRETKPGDTPALPTLHSEMRILRLWLKPWEDSDHDLVDQGYVYVQVDGGHWLLDHVQQNIRDRFAPIRPPHATAPANPNESNAATRTGSDSRLIPTLASPIPPKTVQNMPSLPVGQSQ